jgi:hypothetical protein
MRLEENINRIKEVMGLITEAEQSPQGVEINLGNLFESGKYIITPQVGAKINSGITQIKNFIAKNPGKPVVVTIESSESKVTNYDREKYPIITGDTNNFTPDKKLPVGALSKYRANNLMNYIKPKLPKNTSIVVTDKGAQGPAWDGKNAQDPKYTANQYVKLFAKLNTAQPTPTTEPEQTQEEKERLAACYQTFESSGTYGRADKGFISEQMNVNLRGSEETVHFLLEPYDVPDILIVEYNGQTYTTGLIGIDSEISRLLVGTIIGNNYSDEGSRPWYLKNLKVVPLSPQKADTILNNNYGNWKEDDLKGYYSGVKLERDFFKTKASNYTIFPYALSTGQIKQLTAGVNYWESVQAIKIKKVPGVDTAKVSVVGIVGATQWKLMVRCSSAAYSMVKAGERSRVEY